MSDLEYYRQRELTERELAAAALDPAVQLIHENLAGRYRDLIRGHFGTFDISKQVCYTGNTP